MTALSDRIAAHERPVDGRRACRTEGCDRPVIRDGAFCDAHTTALWSTGTPPPPVARWIEYQREHGLTKEIA